MQRSQLLGHHSFIIDTFPINFCGVLKECHISHSYTEQSVEHFLREEHLADF
jgi:hypothetical protein